MRIRQEVQNDQLAFFGKRLDFVVSPELCMYASIVRHRRPSPVSAGGGSVLGHRPRSPYRPFPPFPFRITFRIAPRHLEHAAASISSMSLCRLSWRCHAHRQLAEQKRRNEPPTRPWATGEPQDGQGAVGEAWFLFLPLSSIVGVLLAADWLFTASSLGPNADAARFTIHIASEFPRPSP